MSKLPHSDHAGLLGLLETFDELGLVACSPQIGHNIGFQSPNQHPMTMGTE